VKSFFYNGIADEEAGQLCMKAKGTKENILSYSLCRNGREWVRVKGHGTEGCRLAKSGSEMWLYISNRLDYPDLSWGNYQRNLQAKELTGGSTELQILPAASR
jgi:beta-galactosidase